MGPFKVSCSLFLLFCQFKIRLASTCTDAEDTSLLQIQSNIDATKTATRDLQQKSFHKVQSIGPPSRNLPPQIKGKGQLWAFRHGYNNTMTDTMCPTLDRRSWKNMACSGSPFQGSRWFIVGVRQILTCRHDQVKPLGCGFGNSFPSVLSVVVEVMLIVAILLAKVACSRNSKIPQLMQAAELLENQEKAPEALSDSSEVRLLHGNFVRHSIETPRAVALIDAEGTLSYGDLQNNALKVAFLLVDTRNIKPRSRTPVGISAEGRHFITGVLGIVQTGNPYVPLTTQWPWTQLQFILEDANIDTVLVDQESLEAVWKNQTQAVPLSLADKVAARSVSWHVAEEDLAYILYTSGSTGQPKGVKAPHRCYFSRLKWMWNTFPFGAGEVGIHKTVPIWVDHIQEVFGYLGGGIPVVIANPIERKDPSKMNALCRQHEVTRIVVVPSLLRVFMAMHGAGFAQELPKLRTWITSGEPLATEVLKSFLSCSAKDTTLINTYGSTEVAGDVTWVSYKAGSELPVGPLAPIGRAMPGVRIHIVDPHTLTPVPQGHEGELVVEGDFVAEGYLNRPDMQKANFLEGKELGAKLQELGVKKAFRTGDFGRVDASGCIDFLGRKDQQVKVHGQRVEVLMVEHVLKESLKECLQQESPLAVIMAVPSAQDPGSYHLHAFVEAGESDCVLAKSINFEDVKLKMLQSLIPAHVPEAFWKEVTLPRLPNSKLDRKTLLELAKEKVKTQSHEIFNTEIDSFGQMRRIAAQYSDGQFAIGCLMVYCLFKVVCTHFTSHWFSNGVILGVPEWVRAVNAYWSYVEDVMILMAGLGTQHGMGGDERFKFSLLEPAILCAWFFGKYILPHILDIFGQVLLGEPLFTPHYCQESVSLQSGPYSARLCPSSLHLYFLLLLLLARIIVVAGHRFTSLFPKKWERPLQCVVILMYAPFCVVDFYSSILKMTWKLESSFYVAIYLIFFYFGPAILPKRSAIPGPWFVLCPVLLAAHIAACYVNLKLGFFPFFYIENDYPLLAGCGHFLVYVPLFMCFLKMPYAFDFRMQGTVLLTIYVVHLEIIDIALRGLSIHGINVFPSYPDLIWTGGLPRHWSNNLLVTDFLATVLQILAAVGYIVALFILIKLACVPIFFVGSLANDTLGKAYKAARTRW